MVTLLKGITMKTYHRTTTTKYRWWVEVSKQYPYMSPKFDMSAFNFKSKHFLEPRDCYIHPLLRFSIVIYQKKRPPLSFNELICNNFDYTTILHCHQLMIILLKNSACSGKYSINSSFVTQTKSSHFPMLNLLLAITCDLKKNFWQDFSKEKNEQV